MLKFLSRLSNRLKASQRPERIDAGRIYAKVMKQSRNPVFFRHGLIEDSMDGRMEWLAAHLSAVLHALQQHGEDGAKLSQAIYDTMVDDFDIALREEGLTDSGVKRRIKPLAKMFLSRAKTYADALNADDVSLENAVQKHLLQERDAPSELTALSAYIDSFSSSFRTLGLDQLVNAGFEFPHFQE